MHFRLLLLLVRPASNFILNVVAWNVIEHIMARLAVVWMKIRKLVVR